MVSPRPRQRLKLPMATLPVAPLAGIAAGVLTALVFGLMPVVTLEGFILRSGLAAVVAAAEPPLGSTARLLLILSGGSFVGLVSWFGLFLLIGSRTVSISAGATGNTAPDVPVLRRADAHPDAPARAPLFANRDLGVPFLEVRAPMPAETPASDLEPADLDPAEPILPGPRIAVVQPQPLPLQPLPIMRQPLAVPRDLDQPMAAFDPAAIPDTPMPPPARPLPSLAANPRPQLIDPGERFETFELTPLVRPERDRSPTPPAAAPRRRAPIDTQATLATLLDRLERGVAQQGEPAATQGSGLKQALGELRAMATRG